MERYPAALVVTVEVVGAVRSTRSLLKMYQPTVVGPVG
jgi:hypothetical protein